MPLVTVKSRHEFLRIRGGARWGTSSFLLEAKRREAAPDFRDEALAAAGQGHQGQAETSALHSTDERRAPAGPARFGFTVTKKLGPAVVRNRIRRRLRELVRQSGAELTVDGCDYVIVARDAALRRPPHALRHDFETALTEVNKRLLQPSRQPSTRANHSRARKAAKSPATSREET